MRVCSIEQMRRLDGLTIKKYGIPSELLMERAGRWVSVIAEKKLENKKSCKVLILVGRGNNGGDGWVAARYLIKMGYRVEVISSVEPKKLTGDAALNFERADQENVQWKIYNGNIPKSDLIIDALLGTGIKGVPRGAIAEIIDLINFRKTQGTQVIAIDIPSGVNGDNGKAPGSAVKADSTVTFGLPKLGQFIHPGREFTGEIYIGDIGLSKKAIEETNENYVFSTLTELHKLLPHRPPDGHKGTFGENLLIGGSAGMTGAVILASISTLRSGLGLCYAAVPRSLVDVVDCSSIETVVVPMPEVRKRRCHTLRALGELHKLVKKVDSVSIGPGLGRHYETKEMVRRLLIRMQKPVVIDADALNALAGTLDDTIPKITAPSVMTPHIGELSRLLGIEMSEILKLRVEKASEWAKLLYTTLLIKGNPTIIADGENPVWFNTSGNHGMATAGSGDVLTGLIGGFLAQGLTPMNAAILGAYIHGLAGDIAAKRFGCRSLIAGDIVITIPEAITTLGNAPFIIEQNSEKIGFKYLETYRGSNIFSLSLLGSE